MYHMEAILSKTRILQCKYNSTERLSFLDSLRDFAVLNMIIYHALWDIERAFIALYESCLNFKRIIKLMIREPSEKRTLGNVGKCWCFSHKGFRFSEVVLSS